MALHLGVTDNQGRCRKLRYDRTKGIWRCAVVELFPHYGTPDNLAVGEGCCCALNSDRQRIPSPEECDWPTGAGYATPALSEAVVFTDVPRVDWRAAFKCLAERLGREFISSDVIYLVAMELESQGHPEAAELLQKAFRSRRSSAHDSFMG